MKKITRAVLRGKRLESFCQRAKRSLNEFGPNDNRIYCYGLNDGRTDELLQQCANCKANIIYVTPLKANE